MNPTEPINVLIINSGTNPISTQKLDFVFSDGPLVEKTILECMNKIGKACHALIKYQNKFYVADHTATGSTPSSRYARREVGYHPYAAQLS